jgi:predicted dehydrogenase
VDAVYVATHNGLHRELVVHALQAGKHVLCEKPLGRSADECREMVAAADAADRHLVEAFMYRHHPQIAEARRRVADGAIGEVTAVEASFHFHLARPDDVRLRREWGGGALMDVGCYCVNFARLFLGDEPAAVHAWADMDGTHGIDRRFHGVLEYAAGTHATVSCGFDGGLYQRAAVIGTEGVLILTEPFVTWERPPRLVIRAGETEEVVTFEPVNPFRLEIEDLATAILDGTPPLLAPDDGLRNARILARLMAAGYPSS